MDGLILLLLLLCPILLYGVAIPYYYSPSTSVIDFFSTYFSLFWRLRFFTFHLGPSLALSSLEKYIYRYTGGYIGHRADRPLRKIYIDNPRHTDKAIAQAPDRSETARHPDSANIPSVDLVDSPDGKVRDLCGRS